MKCKYCGGELPEGAKYCGFCQAGLDEVIFAPPEATSGWQIEEGNGCSGCASPCGNGDNPNTDGALTAVGKDTKYALFIVSLVVIIVACTLFVKMFL